MPRLKQIGIDVDVHRAIEQARHSFSESENDILRRLLLAEKPKRMAPAKPTGIANGAEQTRVRGLWSVEVQGKRTSAANMKEAYRTLLLALDERSSEFLERFALERARSRKYIAQRPTDLYDSSPHLAKDHAHPLKDGWYFDTNLSTEQVATRARAAARVAGMRYGQEVKILENQRLI